MGWSVQERYRGGLNWIFEEVGLSVGGTFSGSESTCVDKGWSGCEKEMQRQNSVFRITRANKPRTAGSLTQEFSKCVLRTPSVQTIKMGYHEDKTCGS